MLADIPMFKSMNQLNAFFAKASCGRLEAINENGIYFIKTKAEDQENPRKKPPLSPRKKLDQQSMAGWKQDMRNAVAEYDATESDDEADDRRSSYKYDYFRKMTKFGNL